MNSFIDKILNFKVIVGIIIIFIVVTCINVLTVGNSKNEFLRYVKGLGYDNVDGGNLYYKLVSDSDLSEYDFLVDNNLEALYEMNYFDVNEIQFIKNKREFSPGISIELNETYDFVTEIVKYRYRGVMGDSSFIYSGDYRYYRGGKEDFTCYNDYSYHIDALDDDKTICDRIHYELMVFYNESMNVIDNERLLVKLKKM